MVATMRKLHSSWPGLSQPSSHTSIVIAGLDPAIHPLRKTLAKKMDTRVKPAYDEICVDGRDKPGHDEKS
jgi:hypothetical protein